MDQLALSFIIPALNEEYFLPILLESIKSFTPKKLTYEVIVADNGSDDNTVALAKKHGASVIVDKTATIGKLRNLAVKQSAGTILVFLDADVSLTEEWCRNIPDSYNSLIDNPKQITGSRCGVPRDASWIETVWFKPLNKKSGKYINSGHLVTPRSLFDLIGGFDEKLETGEDYIFGQAALKVKATIVNNASLSVVHNGYPKSIYQFMRREMWHGRGDCESLKTILMSKVALTSLLFVLLHLVAVFDILFYSGIGAVVSIILIFIMNISAARFKHGVSGIKNIFSVSFLYYIYFGSRFLSCISFLSTRDVSR